jgi:ABC-type multidrug transport system fused ATPase/permease subunit
MWPLFTLVKQAGDSQEKALRDLNTQLVDTLSVMKTVRAMAREIPFEQYLQRQARALQKTGEQIVKVSGVLHVIHEPLLTFIIAVGIVLVVDFGHYPFSEIVIIGFLFWRVAMQLARAQNTYSAMNAHEPYFWQLQDTIARAKQEIETSSGTVKAAAECNHICFEDVSFAYNNVTILDRLSFQAKP